MSEEEPRGGDKEIPKPAGADTPVAAEATGNARTDTGSPPTQDEAIGRLRGDAVDMSSVRSGEIISDLIERLDGPRILNVFMGEFTGGIAAGDDPAAARRTGGRRATRTRVNPDQLAMAIDGYVRPAGFADGVDLLNRNNLVFFAGPAGTGRRSRALASLAAVLADNGMEPVVFELSGNVLGNRTWRVPQARCGLLIEVGSDGRGRSAADPVDDAWLGYAAEQLRARGSYLAVVTTPVSGALASAPSRPEHVLEDMELADPAEIVVRRVIGENPWLTEPELRDRLAGAGLAEILGERDEPRFAMRLVKAATEALRRDAGADLRAALGALDDPEDQVREWLGVEPDLADVAWVLATAVLEGLSYLRIADAAVALLRELSGGSGSTTPRYLRRLTAERSWIEFRRRDGEPDAPQVLCFRRVELRAAVLAVIWSELDGARPKIQAWLGKLVQTTDVEVRARAAGAVGLLAIADFEHGLHRYLRPWADSNSPSLRQSAALGMGVVGTVGRQVDDVWDHIEQWAELVRDDRKRFLPATAALAAGGPLGAADPHRALRVVRILSRDGDWGFVEPAASCVVTLLAKGKVGEVLAALADWTGGRVVRDSQVKALIMFAFAAGEVGPGGVAGKRPLLLDSVREHASLLCELWSRALTCEPVREFARGALEFWVRYADDDPRAQRPVLLMLAGIAEHGDMYERLLHLLAQLAQDREHPSGSAAYFHDELVDAGEMTA